MNRRGFLSGMIGLIAAPAIVRVSSLMAVQAVPLPSHTLVLDLSRGNAFSVTLSGNTTVLFVNEGAAAPAPTIVSVTNFGSHRLTWPRDVRWRAGQPPALSRNGTNMVAFAPVPGMGTLGYPVALGLAA